MRDQPVQSARQIDIADSCGPWERSSRGLRVLAGLGSRDCPVALPLADQKTGRYCWTVASEHCDGRLGFV